MSVPTVRFNVSLPKPFLQAVDQAALGQGLSRSAFIRLALLEKMNLQSVVDMTPMPPKGTKIDPDEEFDKFMHGLYGR